MLVVIDDHSKYPEVETMSSTTATDVVPKLEKTMATRGLIEELHTDKRPSFNGQEFSEYLKSHSKTHWKITPQWPQANGEVERFMRTLGKVIRIAQASRQGIEEAIHVFLGAYRQTPHVTTEVPPSQACLGQRVVGMIPHHPGWVSVQVDEDILFKHWEKDH